MTESSINKGTGGSAARRPPPQLASDVQGRLEEYLARVEASLAQRSVAPPDRRAQVIALRARVTQELAARSGARPATVADAEAVLAALGPAESIAPASSSPSPSPSPSRAAPLSAARAAAQPAPRTARRPRVKGTLSKLAIAGAAWAPLFFLMLILGRWQTPLNVALQPLGWSAPIATTVLGLMAIGSILKSGGAKYGLSLALFDTMLFPLLILNALIVWVARQMAIQLIQQDVTSPAVADAMIGQIFPVLAIILGDYYLVRRAWAALRADGE